MHDQPSGSSSWGNEPTPEDSVAKGREAGRQTDIMSTIKVNVKPTAGGDKFSVDVQTSANVRELKEAVAGKCTIAADEQRLIYKGQVLKDERTVESYGESAAVLRCPS